MEKVEWTNFSCKLKMIYPKLSYPRVLEKRNRILLTENVVSLENTSNHK